MNRLSTLIKKVRRKGLRGSFRVLCERYFYYHCELLTLERSLALPLPCPIPEERWPRAKITGDLLPAFDKHFAAQLPAIRGLISKGCTGYAHLDEHGNVMMMIWVNERDYYDDQLYRCWVRIPPRCLYQFAGECAAPYRGTGAVLLLEKMLWDEYRARGFETSRVVVNANNHAALKMHVRVGYEEVGESIHVYCVLRLFHFHRYTSYHLPRLLHLRKGRLLSRAKQLDSTL